MRIDSLRQSDNPRILHAGSNIIKHFFDPKRSEHKNSKKGFSVYNMYAE